MSFCPHFHTTAATYYRIWLVSEILTLCNRQGKQQLPAPCWELLLSAGIRASWQAGLKTPASFGSLGRYTGA